MKFWVLLAPIAGVVVVAAAAPATVTAKPLRDWTPTTGGAQRASPAEREKDKAVAVMNSALERSRGDPQFEPLRESGDADSLARLLVGNGAPADTKVTIVPGDEGTAGSLQIECCAKKGRGPVVVEAQ